MKKRSVEVFIAGCPACAETVALVKATVCADCEVSVHDMRTEHAQAAAKKYNIHRFPTVVVDGRIAGCCQQQRVDAQILHEMGVGSPL